MVRRQERDSVGVGDGAFEAGGSRGGVPERGTGRGAGV